MTPSTFYWLLSFYLIFCYAVSAERYTDCEFPPSVNYATAKLVVENDNVVQAIYTCDNGYELQGPEQLICDIDADEWNTDPPICVSSTETQPAENNEPKRKKKLNDIPEDRAVPADMAASLDMSCAEAKLKAPDVKNGFVQKYERRRRNQHIFLAAIFSCNEGFELEDMDVATLYCSQQRWIGSLPNCLSLSDYDYEEYEEEQNNEEKATNANEADADAEAENDTDTDNEEEDYNEEETPAAVPAPEQANTASEADEEQQERSDEKAEEEQTAANADVESVTQDPYTPRLLDNECGGNNGGCEQICERVLFSGENEPRIRCACFEGFSLDPYNYTACLDIDECQIHNGGCEQICHNTPGSFNCGCEEGLQIDANDGTHCVDIDECQSEDIVAQCAGSCVNTHGSYTCTSTAADSGNEAAAVENVEEQEKQNCAAGYEWSEQSQNCVDIDECVFEARNCAFECQNTPGSYSCICPAQQHLLDDAHSCEPDTCADLVNYNKTKCAFQCEDLPNAAGHLCTCPANYQLAEDLHNCVVADHACAENDGYNACAPGQCLASDSNEAGFICECPAGYESSAAGTSCQDIDECIAGSHECSHACFNTAGSYECSCPGGYQLKPNNNYECEDIDECLSKPNLCGALNCINLQGSFQCQCANGASPNAETGLCADESSPCAQENNGCSQICEYDGSCSCQAGFTLADDAKSCVDVNECLVNNGGCQQLCSNYNGGYQCSCNAGFEMLLTDNGHAICFDIDECAIGTHTCDENMLCENLNGSFTCLCPAGYALGIINSNNAPLSHTHESLASSLSSATQACLDIDECSINNGNCTHFCINHSGGYQCACPPDFILSSADNNTCKLVNPCFSANNGGCAQLCHFAGGLITCACHEGFVLGSDAKSCVDVNECHAGNGGCAQLCLNYDSGFSCACHLGYQLAPNGHDCLDENECYLRNDNCSHMCINLPGSFVCACEFGFELDQDQQTCLDIDECAKGTHQCSHECNNTPGGYVCACPSGFDLDNRALSCLDVNECVLGTHQCSHHCLNTDGAYVCACPEGFELHADAHNCVELLDRNSCDFNNGGCSHLCDNVAGCSCPDGYGLAADNSTCVHLDECSVNNGGCSHVCVNRGGGHECRCPAGYKLSKIDASTCIDIDECLAPHICEHECVNTNGSYVCKCPKGYELHNSRFCKDINECEFDNGGCIGGECINHNGGHECRCPAGQRLLSDARTCESHKDLRDQCPPFVAPLNGEIHCTKYRHKKKLFYNTKCNVWCNPGYKLVGSARRYCNATGLWDNNESRCMPIVCPRLQPARNGLILPTSCTLGKVYMGEWCRIQCQPGFVPIQRPAAVCTARGIWNHNATLECVPGKFTLLDPRSNGVFGKESKIYKTSSYPISRKTTQSVQAPFIKCPRNTTVLLSKGEKTVFIKLHKPVTNLDYRLIESHPAWAKNLQAHLPAGKYSLNFRGRVPETGKIVSCQTVIIIRRSAAPRINYCTPPFEVTLSPNQAYRSITWEEPRFQVSSGSIKKIIRSRIPGELFGLGEHTVYYEASSDDGVTARCEFKIYVKAAPSTPLPLMPAVDLDFSNNIVPARVQNKAPRTGVSLLPGHESYIMCPGQAPVKVNKSVEIPANCYIKNVRINHNRHLMRLFRSEQWLPFRHF